jgi:hypothetical protein
MSRAFLREGEEDGENGGDRTYGRATYERAKANEQRQEE